MRLSSLCFFLENYAGSLFILGKTLNVEFRISFIRNKSFEFMPVTGVLNA